MMKIHYLRMDLTASSNSALRTSGINIPSADLLIATAAHAQHLPLLAKDAHFEIIRKHALPKLKILNPT